MTLILESGNFILHFYDGKTHIFQSHNSSLKSILNSGILLLTKLNIAHYLLRDHVQDHYHHHHQEVVQFLNGKVTKYVMMRITILDVNGMEEIAVDNPVIHFNINHVMCANVWIQILILVISVK